MSSLPSPKGPVAVTLYVATNQFGKIELVGDVAVLVGGDVDVAVPGAAPVVVHEDVDDLAWLPVGAGQRDEAAGRVVIEVAGDGRRGDRLGGRRLSGRFGGGCRSGRSCRLFWRRLRSCLRRRFRRWPRASASGVGSALGSAEGVGDELGSALGSSARAATGATRLATSRNTCRATSSRRSDGRADRGT